MPEKIMSIMKALPTVTQICKVPQNIDLIYLGGAVSTNITKTTISCQAEVKEFRIGAWNVDNLDCKTKCASYLKYIYITKRTEALSQPNVWGSSYVGTNPIEVTLIKITNQDLRDMGSFSPSTPDQVLTLSCYHK